MNWLENNPVAVVLASACGVLLLISAALIFVWTRPASSGVDAAENQGRFEAEVDGPSSDLGPISQYKAVTDRPLFEETRRPVVSVEIEEGQDEGLAEREVSGKPEVALSGVVITGDQRIVTLRPQGGGESIIAQEGQSLGESYPGWAVTDVKPRKIVLASLDGDSLELDLAINTRTIAEPPKPEPEPAALDSTGEAETGEGAPLSRAEEIRQRIAERREELRRQAEENEQSEPQKMRTQYQNAIQNMIKRKENNDETKDGNGNGN